MVERPDTLNRQNNSLPRRKMAERPRNVRVKQFASQKKQNDNRREK